MLARLLVLLLTLSASGCGYKGPLYLPVAKPSAPKPSTIVTPDPARPLPAETTPPPQ